MKDLELILNGTDAEGAARDLAEVLADANPRLAPRPLDTPAAVPHRTIDPVAVSALVLSIPAALLAVLDLADRVGKRRRAKRLIESAARIRIERRVEVMTITADGARPLADLDPDLLLDLVEKS